MIVNSYYEQINQYDLLTPEEEQLYATRALLGDEEAGEALVTANLRFVVTIAKQYQGQGVPLEDLINEGNMGLINTVMRYDPTMKYKFITYASWWIRQRILKALGEQNRTIRIPANKIALLSKVRSATDKLTASLERPPTQDEISDFLGGDIDISQIYEIEDRPVELDGSTISDDVRFISDTIPDRSQPSPDELMKPEMFMEELNSILKDFSDREKDILYLYHGIGTGGAEMTLEQIGYTYGICRERVRQIKKSALKKMRNHPDIDKLREFL